MTIKILNLYAGIGGNRKLWTGDIEVTAVEINPEIAKIYKDLFPNDKVIIADAHEFLKLNYMKYDFIWSSPPCQTHSSFRKNICVRFHGSKAEFPDMKLYEEILFLTYFYKGIWVVENVNPYYPVLIPAKKIQRHLFWASFEIENKEFAQDNIRSFQIPQLQKLHGFNLANYRIKNKRQVLRNCINPELGLYVFNQAINNDY